MLELRHLATLKAIEEAGSLVEAAERLQLPASAFEVVNEYTMWVDAPGGAIRILDTGSFLEHLGRFNYDSERSKSERDFRVYVQPSAWEAVRDFCLQNLKMENSSTLETEQLVDAAGVNRGRHLGPIRPDFGRLQAGAGLQPNPTMVEHILVQVVADIVVAEPHLVGPPG